MASHHILQRRNLTTQSILLLRMILTLFNQIVKAPWQLSELPVDHLGIEFLHSMLLSYTHHTPHEQRIRFSEQNPMFSNRQAILDS
jgi:hypothetical protein